MNTNQILALVASLLAPAVNLLTTIIRIKDATEAEHPEVWAEVRSRFGSSLKNMLEEFDRVPPKG